MNQKWTIIYSLAITLLVASTYVLTLPLDTKLRFFCTTDNDHIAETPPTSNSGDYWTSPNTGTKLEVITIWVAIDAGMWLYYDNTENIFWIGVLTGPMKSSFYGPYPGILWTLTNIINPLALAGATVSIAALIYQPIRKLWTKAHITTAANIQRSYYHKF